MKKSALTLPIQPLTLWFSNGSGPRSNVNYWISLPFDGFISETYKQ